MTKFAAALLMGTLAIGAFGAGGTVAANAAPVSSHTAWCEQNYRSYNPATDAYTGNDGLSHACVSPGETRTFDSVAPTPFISVPSNDTQGFRNPNGPGSGTTFRVFPGDQDSTEAQ